MTKPEYRAPSGGGQRKVLLVGNRIVVGDRAQIKAMREGKTELTPAPRPGAALKAATFDRIPPSSKPKA